MKLNIEECTSAGIRNEAIKQGISEIELLAEAFHPDHPGEQDWKIKLWKVDGPWWAIETNGDPIFESDQPAFDDLLNEYGIAELV